MEAFACGICIDLGILLLSHIFYLFFREKKEREKKKPFCHRDLNRSEQISFEGLKSSPLLFADRSLKKNVRIIQKNH